MSALDSIWHYDACRLGRLRLIRDILRDSGNPTMVEELDEAIHVFETVVRAQNPTTPSTEAMF